jgi:carboxylesterase type B
MSVSSCCVGNSTGPYLSEGIRSAARLRVNFPENGDPNREGLPKWPAFEQNSDRALEFGHSVK